MPDPGLSPTVSSALCLLAAVTAIALAFVAVAMRGAARGVKKAAPLVAGTAVAGLLALLAEYLKQRRTAEEPAATATVKYSEPATRPTK